MQFHLQKQSVGPAHFLHAPWLLLGFIVISLLVHGSTFLLSTNPMVQLPEQRFGATVISVVLAPAKNKPASPSSRSTTPSAQEKRKKPDPFDDNARPRVTLQSSIPSTAKTTLTTSIIENQTQPAAQSAIAHASSEHATIARLETSADREAPATQESLSKQLTQQRNYLLGELQNQLKQYLSYPLRARRRGWQGEVTVAFYIDEGGRLNNVRLTRSSGYSILDHSVISAIGKLKSIDLPDRLGRLQAMELNLPVSYQLHEG